MKYKWGCFWILGLPETPKKSNRFQNLLDSKCLCWLPLLNKLDWEASGLCGNCPLALHFPTWSGLTAVSLPPLSPPPLFLSSRRTGTGRGCNQSPVVFIFEFTLLPGLLLLGFTYYIFSVIFMFVALFRGIFIFEFSVLVNLKTIQTQKS